MPVTPNEQSPVNRYRRLGGQVSRIRWILPILLSTIVFIVETMEHVVHDHEPTSVDYWVEVTLFAVIGPAVVAGVLTWITRNLELLAKAHEQIETFNAELEEKIKLRTAELEKANIELLQLDRLKSEFVSLVSHELRTPLTNIRGGLEVIASERNSNCSPMTRETLSIVQAEVTRLIRLVLHILDVSALESGQLRLNLGPVALRPIIDHIKKDLRLLNDGHPLQLEIPAQPLLMIADEERITDVLANLLSNAIKYSPEGSPILVRLEKCGDHAQISVKDQGIGIPPDEQQYVMNQFYRGISSRHVPGYGLGLYFANKLVEAHGGRLWIESTGVPGQGTEFHFTLPVDKETGDDADTVD